jgi:hypothetical protein
MNPQTTSMVVMIAVVVLVMALRLRRMNQLRPLRLERMWIMPAILTFALVMTFWQFRPHAMDWVWIVAFAALGAGIGWYRGRMMQIHVDPETHALNQKASPAAMIFIIAIIGIRMALRTEAPAMGLNINLVTDASIAFAAAMFTAVRVEMFLRAQRLLTEARAGAKPGDIVT